MENNNSLGYQNPLYILPFDHRTGLYKELNWIEPLTQEQVLLMKDGRKLLFEAIKLAVEKGIPKNCTPVFTEDIFGREVLETAKKEGFITFLTTEKSGCPFFDFEHGESFKEVTLEIRPTATKALVRYNPESNIVDNQKSLHNLKRLSDFSHKNGYKFLIEPLIIPTIEQLQQVEGDRYRFDNELRPNLTVKMMQEMHTAGIEPDIWKIEGFDNSNHYTIIAQAAQTKGRDHVGIISLGRNETDEVVSAWLQAGAQVPAVIGFAVGRTIFLEPLKAYYAGSLTREQARTIIAEKFVYFYRVFIETKKNA